MEAGGEEQGVRLMLLKGFLMTNTFVIFVTHLHGSKRLTELVQRMIRRLSNLRHPSKQQLGTVPLVFVSPFFSFTLLMKRNMLESTHVETSRRASIYSCFQTGSG